MPSVFLSLSFSFLMYSGGHLPYLLYQFLGDESISLKFQPSQSLAKNQFIYVERIYILSTLKSVCVCECVCSLPWRQKNVNIDINNTY